MDGMSMDAINRREEKGWARSLDMEHVNAIGKKTVGQG